MKTNWQSSKKSKTKWGPQSGNSWAIDRPKRQKVIRDGRQSSYRCLAYCLVKKRELDTTETGQIFKGIRPPNRNCCNPIQKSLKTPGRTGVCHLFHPSIRKSKLKLKFLNLLAGKGFTLGMKKLVPQWNWFDGFYMVLLNQKALKLKWKIYHTPHIHWLLCTIFKGARTLLQWCKLSSLTWTGSVFWTPKQKISQ